jgi:hypothetical protein
MFVYYLYIINTTIMKIENIIFKYTMKKLEFLNLEKDKKKLIHSIRFGSINKEIGFINMTDYSVIKFKLTESTTVYNFNIDGNKYQISKDKLQSNSLIKFELIA